MTDVNQSARDVVMYDPAFQRACQNYAHGNGSSAAIAQAAIASMPATQTDPLQSYAKFDGVGPHAETIETRAAIGERYLDCYESALSDPRIKGYSPADCPSELLLDILNNWAPQPDQDKLISDQPQYLVWSNEHKVWWGKDQRGYTSIIANAGRYSRDEALSIARKRDGGWHVGKGNPDEIAIPEQDAIDQYADITRAQGGAS